MALPNPTPAVSIPSGIPALAALLAERVPEGQGAIPSRIDGVHYMRSALHVPRSHIAYKPGIVIIAQGRKIGHVGNRTIYYGGGHYLALTLPLPFECETVGNPDEPMLGLHISLNSALVSEVVLQMNEPESPPPKKIHSIDSTAIDPTTCDAACRLVRALGSDAESRILGQGCIRELVFRVLCGPLGHNVRALAAPDSKFGQISRIVNRINEHCVRPMTTESLAREAGMAVSTFHNHFKAVTACAPLQFIKRTRLHKARLLMLNKGMAASEAAIAVGYESASQFSREFKRLFGAAPATAVAELRRQSVQFL